MKGFMVVVNKSTVPVGTGDEFERIIRTVNPSADFAVCRIRNSCAKAQRFMTSSIRIGLSLERTILAPPH